MKSLLTSLVSLPLCLFLVAGCAADAGQQGDDAAAVDDGQATADALTATVEDGTTAKTTANLRLRSAASTSSDTIDTMPKGATVTIVDGTPQNGFYKVSYDGNEGFASGNYLVLEGGSDDSDDHQGAGGGDVGHATGEAFTTKGTGYYPANNQLEGGFVDRRGAKLHTLQQFLAGSADYVSVAMDSNAFNYGQKLRIRELEVKYNRVIEFRVVDTGGAFRGKGRTRMDICTASNSASLDPTINGQLHVNIQ